MKQFFEIRKVDEELRMVWGYASTSAVDSQGETVARSAMEAAWDDYMKFGNIREMHTASAVGVVKEYEFDDAGVMIGAHIVDDMAWKKVVGQVYKGFSIGGKKIPGGYDPITQTITALQLTEISLVDRPANPEALITMWKADTMKDDTMSKEANTAAPVDELADLLNKGEIGIDRLIELAKSDISKNAEAEKVVTVAHNTEVPAVEASPKNDETTDVEKTAVAAVPCELQKSIALLRSTGEDVQKSLYAVSRFFDLVQSLVWLQHDCAIDCAIEGETSALLGQIGDAVSVLAGLLLQMANEEVGELVQSMNLPAESDPITMLSSVIANCETGKEYSKFHEAFDILKAGARNSQPDAERIQKSHDLMVELGASRKPKEDDISMSEKLQKASDAGTIVKVLSDFEKMAGELGEMRKSFGLLNDSHAELTKNYDSLLSKYDALPTAPKGALKVIEKGDDISGSLESADADTVTPVVKHDGTVDDVATMIKKLHATGGRPFGT